MTIKELLKEADRLIARSRVLIEQAKLVLAAASLLLAGEAPSISSLGDDGRS